MIDLITIVFQQELYLLELQARSIELYVDSDRINHIYVVVNDVDDVVDLIDSAWWGVNSQKVVVIPRSRWGHVETLPGWESQQLYKLLAAESAASDWSMCLDAKTWFVKQLDWDQLFSHDGRVHYKSIPTINVFELAQCTIEQLLNVSLSTVIGPGGVPFMFHTETVKDMFVHLKNITGTNFIDFFAEYVLIPYQVTEFMLYSGFVNLKHKSHDALYSQQQYYTVTNMADWQLGEFDKIIKSMNSTNNLTASIQGRAYPHLTDSQLDTWCNFLLNKNLINDPQEAKNKLNILRYPLS